MERTQVDVKAIDFVIINVPAFLFMLGSLLSLAVILIGKTLPVLPFALFAWWCTAGMVMLFIDYSRKKVKFIRLLKLQKGSKLAFPSNLKSTICGLCIIWALKNRTKTM